MNERAGSLLRGAAIAVLAAGCGAAPAPAPVARRTAPRPPAPILGPARYLTIDARRIERAEDGRDRAVAGGRRLILRGPEIAAVGPAEPAVDGGAALPAWAAGTTRYVFWRGTRLWGAESFLGALRPIGTLPAEPLGAFAWLDGVGLQISGGVLVAAPAGGAPGRSGLPALTRGMAADARRALGLTALGHAFLTLDGGASFRDVSADLGGARWMEARGDRLAAELPDGRVREVTAAGEIVDGKGTLRRRAGVLPDPAADPDPFLDASGVRPIEAALRSGLPLADGGVVIAGHGFVGRLDAATLRVTSVAPLEPGLGDAACTPVRAGGAVVLACAAPERAAVVDLEGAPRTERTFDLVGAADLDRFVAGDDAIAFLGPCDGSPPRAPEPGALGEPESPARQQTPAICVRAGRDEWVEHRLPPSEARELVAWIPRAGGGAVALLARPGQLLEERERVEVRGALRVVRLARSEPPLSLGTYGSQLGERVDDSLRVLGDDTITGWLPGGGGNGPGEVAVTIDPAGHAHVHALPPQVTSVAHAGPLALASGDDGRLWETVDGGRRWTEVEPPPVGREGEGAAAAVASSCSPAGCSVGGFERLGWSGHAGGEAHATPPLVDVPGGGRPRSRYRRGLPPAPVVRLSCSAASMPEGRRMSDSAGFGYTPQPRPRSAGGLVKVGPLGMAQIPWNNGSQLPAAGEIELGWLAPLDPAGAVRRATVPIGRLGLPPGTGRPHDLRLGYLLAPDGSLSTFPAGRDECFASLLEAAGAARSLGACAADPSVGVDLGGRVVVLHASHSAVHVSTAELAAGKPARGGRAAAAQRVPVALHEIHETPMGSPLRGFSLGAGVRGSGEAVAVVLDVTGQASLAPIDAERGTLGAEERLRPLFEAELGSSAACRGPARPGEARVVLPFEGAIAVDPKALRGVGQAQGAGVAVLRWSRERACLDAVEVPVRDERLEESPSVYEGHGLVRRVVARFDGKAQAALLLVGPGMEARQRLSCTALRSGSGEP